MAAPGSRPSSGIGSGEKLRKKTWLLRFKLTRKKAEVA